MSSTIPRGTIYMIATPIGNRGDLSMRAKEVLASVAYIYCEDTRVSKPMLHSMDIHTPTRAYHEHSNRAVYTEIEALLADGKDLAFITDAGTPGISDPGGKMLSYIYQTYPEQMVSPIPGPSAMISALSVCGFPTHRFRFLGFPPQKKKRMAFFEEIATSVDTVVFYESPYRIEKALTQLSTLVTEDRLFCVCRELTKKFETISRGNISSISSQIKVKGEFVVVVSGRNYSESSAEEKL